MKKYAWILIGIIGTIELFVAIAFVIIMFPLSKTASNLISITPITPIPTLKSTPSTEGLVPSHVLGITTLKPTPSPKGPFPSQVIDLTNWKITLPFGTSKKSAHPLEVRQPDLATYKVDPWFTLTSDAKGVVFRAPVTGPTTGGTKYARSELREMTDNGKTPASWSSSEGIHTMFLAEAITSVPKTKQHVVAGQIHDDNDDIIVIRLEYPNLYVNVNGKNVYTLDLNYTLGKQFTIKFVVNEGITKVYYNGNANPSYVLNQNYDSAYFKAGAYTQSNCSTEGTDDLCNTSNYGEVILYQATTIHQ